MKRLAWLPLVITVALFTGALLLAPKAFGITAGPWSLTTVAASAAGTMIVLRRPRHPIGWLFTAFALLTSGGYFLYSIAEQTESPIVGGWADAIGSAMATVAVILLPAALLRFPDGELPSGRWRWLSVVIALAAGAGGLAALLNGGWGGDATQSIWPSPLREASAPLADAIANLFFLLMTFTMVAAGISLIVRFRRTQGPAREQMKWLAASASFLILALVLAFIIDPSVTLTDDWLIWVVAAAFASVPAAVAIAVLRYRLYDIDRIINRTIVYGLASGAVVAVYAAVVFLFSTVAAGSSNDLVVALATLTSAAAIRPALRRTQRFVDQRFYRRRFDVQQTVERFGAELHRVGDIGEITTDLAGVVRSTMHPDRVAIWLRPAETD